MDPVSSLVGAAAASFVGGASEELGKSVAGGVKNALNFPSNHHTLRTELENLTTKRDSVKAQLELAENDDGGQGRYQYREEVAVWLKAVEDLDKEVNSILDRIDSAGNRFQYGYLGVTMGMEVANNLTKVKQLIEDGNFPSGGLLVETNPPRRVELMPGPSIISEDQSTAASKTLSNVLTLLNDKDVTRIGVWGMGGVGKTVLVQNLNNICKDYSSSRTPRFSIVIWATVSRDFDLKRVQRQIAERLGLSLSNTMGERNATLLFNRFLEIVSFLLILDDVWDPIDLDDLGIPQPEQHKSYKVILTSRFLDVCRQMGTDMDVKVEILSEEESWKLFTSKAGNVATLPHIEPLAKQLARECCGLPLAIIVVGASMRGKKMIELWKDALNALRTSTPYNTGIEDRVYMPLKWSYDSLQDSTLFKHKNKGNHFAASYDLLPNLEELFLQKVGGINNISQLADRFGLRLSKLRVIQVATCYDMNYVLSVGGSDLSLESLEEVEVRSCGDVVEVFRCESSSQTSALVDTYALNLKIVKLENIGRLATLSQPHVSWHQLERLQVIDCERLKKLPFTAQIANTLKEIRGSSQWWDQLEWDDEDTKSKLQQYFTRIIPKNIYLGR